MNELQDKKDLENREEFVYLATNPWNPYLSVPDVQGRQQEILKLERYLVYLKDQGEYERRASTALKAAKETMIRIAMSDFNTKELLELEDKVWGWSPLFQALKSRLPIGASSRPWKHSREELTDLLACIDNDLDNEKKTLEVDCPHIVRALKIYARLSPTQHAPIAHPIQGMTRRRLLNSVEDKAESQRLSFCAELVGKMGWTLFPCISVLNVEPISNCWNDLNALIGFQGCKKEEVIAKVESFLGRVAIRAIADIHRTRRYTTVLEKMWLADSDVHEEITPALCVEVRNIPSLVFACYSDPVSLQLIACTLRELTNV